MEDRQLGYFYRIKTNKLGLSCDKPGKKILPLNVGSNNILSIIMDDWVPDDPVFRFSSKKEVSKNTVNCLNIILRHIYFCSIFFGGGSFLALIKV